MSLKLFIRYLSTLSICPQKVARQYLKSTRRSTSTSTLTDGPNPDDIQVLEHEGVELDNTKTTQQSLEQDIVNDLIKLMVVSSEERVPVMGNEQLTNIYHYWNIYDKNDLPLTNPTEITPFEFQSTRNADISYVEHPRLSVTKLLISGWCELRELYRVFAGSVRTPPSVAMQAGSRVHLKLEQEIHEVIDLRDIESFIKANAEEIMRLPEWQASVEGSEPGIFNMEPVDSLAIDWSESIIERLYSLIATSEAREVLLHGYLDLKQGLFVEDSEKLSDSSSVLVSGIVDDINVNNTKDHLDDSLFEEIHAYIEQEHEQVDEVPLVDLSKFFGNVEEILAKYPDFKLTFSDLKTRLHSSLPKQESVLEGAKFQTFYYRHMFELLSEDPAFTYHCLLENAKRRGFDVDEPLSVLTTFKIFRQHYHLLFNDFQNLAEGKPIGFAPFDQQRPNLPYEFGKIFVTSDEFQKKGATLLDRTKFIQELGKYDQLSYDQLLLPLLKTWKTPPTLRYLAARSAQFYGIFGKSLGDRTSVEYRSSFSEKIIDTMSYEYNLNQLHSETKHAAEFWDGKIDARPTDDILRCQHCDFKSKCVIPKTGKLLKQKNKSLGPNIRKFLNDVKHLQKDS